MPHPYPKKLQRHSQHPHGFAGCSIRLCRVNDGTRIETQRPDVATLQPAKLGSNFWASRHAAAATAATARTRARTAVIHPPAPEKRTNAFCFRRHRRALNIPPINTLLLSILLGRARSYYNKKHCDMIKTPCTWRASLYDAFLLDEAVLDPHVVVHQPFGHGNDVRKHRHIHRRVPIACKRTGQEAQHDHNNNNNNARAREEKGKTQTTWCFVGWVASPLQFSHLCGVGDVSVGCPTRSTDKEREGVFFFFLLFQNRLNPWTTYFLESQRYNMKHVPRVESIAVPWHLHQEFCQKKANPEVSSMLLSIGPTPTMSTRGLSQQLIGAYSLKSA